MIHDKNTGSGWFHYEQGNKVQIMDHVLLQNGLTFDPSKQTCWNKNPRTIMKLRWM